MPCWTHPELRSLFGPEALAEVGVTATLPNCEGRPLDGRIDLLIRRDGAVLAVDFKSNRVVPPDPGSVPPAILVQLGAYRAALAQVFPDRPVHVAVLWTRAPLLMPLPDEMVEAALQAATTS